MATGASRSTSFALSPLPDREHDEVGRAGRESNLRDPLFRGVRGRQILGSRNPRSCMDRGRSALQGAVSTSTAQCANNAPILYVVVPDQDAKSCIASDDKPPERNRLRRQFSRTKPSCSKPPREVRET